MAADQKHETPRVRLSVLMPVRNEGASFKTVVKVINALLETPCEILAVHDAPDDDAVAAVADLRKTFDNVFCVYNRRGRGVANAVISGVEASRGEYVVTFAADDIGPILTLDRMVRFMDAGCEFVSVTRYALGGKCFGGSKIARFLSRMANKSFMMLSSSTLSDCTMGFKMFRQDVFSAFELSPDGAGWSFAFEMSIKAQLLRLRIGEVPVVSLNRLFDDEGTSSFRLAAWVKVYMRWYVYGIRRLHLLRRREPRMMKVPNVAR
jgi:dolichol-phosphate mannosyltransferase